MWRSVPLLLGALRTCAALSRVANAIFLAEHGERLTIDSWGGREPLTFHRHSSEPGREFHEALRCLQVVPECFGREHDRVTPTACIFVLLAGARAFIHGCGKSSAKCEAKGLSIRQTAYLFYVLKVKVTDNDTKTRNPNECVGRGRSRSRPFRFQSYLP